MKYVDKIKLSKIVLESYKSMMIPIYKEFRSYDSVEVRLETVKILNNHCHSKLLEFISGRKHRKLKFKKIKQELELATKKNEFDNFVDSIL